MTAYVYSNATASTKLVSEPKPIVIYRTLSGPAINPIEFRKQSGLPFTSRSVNRVIDEYVALRERQQTQGRTSIHRLRQIMRVVKFWREYISDQSIESIGNKELSGYVRMVTRMYPWRELHESRTA
jgi:hypothetical protein